MPRPIIDLSPAMTATADPRPLINTDPAHDILRTERQPLDYIFRPQSVAVVGATDRAGSVGRTVLANMQNPVFKGKLFAVNPKRKEVLGVPSYPSISDIPQKVDLVVVVTPAATVPDVIRDCVRAGAGGVVIISAGFKEVGEHGQRLEAEIMELVRSTRIRIIGPNCLGVMSPAVGLNATFAAGMPMAGNVAFLSQSGALCTAILDRSIDEQIGFSAFISTGSMLDVNWGDLLYYYGDDPSTRSILLYMESVGNAGAFLSAAREVALKKPIIVIKAGRTAAAAKAAASHTGSLTGSDDVLDAAFRRCGVLRVNTIDELFSMAEVLGKQPLPKGPRLGIVTNAGGPAVLATDALYSSGGELAALEPKTIESLNSFLPQHWSHANPVDILGDADHIRYQRALEAVVNDPNTDGVLAILAPQAMTSSEAAASAVVPFRDCGKPVLASWMGGTAVAAGEQHLNQAGIPTFTFPETSVRAFTYMWQYSYGMRALYETPNLSSHLHAPPDYKTVDAILAAAREKNRTILTEAESKRLLAAYNIPTVTTEVAADEDAAVAAAERIGYPVVVKLHSETITHKSDVGGVVLNLTTPDSVRAAFRQVRDSVSKRASAADFHGVAVQRMAKLSGYELILGSSTDSQFGPVLLFGAGGKLVEIFEDRALGLPPLNSVLARRMMEQTRIFKALLGVRGERPVDITALVALLVRFSCLVAEQPWIKELDINPLLASSDSLIALDARVVLHPAGTPESKLSYPPIRPYPLRYVTPFRTRGGMDVTIRPVRPEDEPLIEDFHRKLSARSVYLRYYKPLALEDRITHERLARICHIDYDREMALLILRGSGKDEEVLAVGRVSKLHGRNQGRITLLIRDEFQRHGLGRELMQRLIGFAKDEKLDRLLATMTPENKEMQGLALKTGFKLQLLPGESMMEAVLELNR